MIFSKESELTVINSICNVCRSLCKRMFVWAALNYDYVGWKGHGFVVIHFFTFPFKLWYIIKCSAFVIKNWDCCRFSFIQDPFVCNFFFFASIPIPQSLLTVYYWSGSWYLNWSMSSVTCLRYPTWAISLNNVFINWLIITVRLISCIYICVLSTIDLYSNNHAYLSRSWVLHHNLIIIKVKNSSICVQKWRQGFKGWARSADCYFYFS